MDDRAFLTALAERNRVQLYEFADEPTLRGTMVTRWTGSAWSYWDRIPTMVRGRRTACVFP